MFIASAMGFVIQAESPRSSAVQNYKQRRSTNIPHAGEARSVPSKDGSWTAKHICPCVLKHRTWRFTSVEDEPWQSHEVAEEAKEETPHGPVDTKVCNKMELSCKLYYQISFMKSLTHLTHNSYGTFFNFVRDTNLKCRLNAQEMFIGIIGQYTLLKMV